MTCSVLAIFQIKVSLKDTLIYLTLIACTIKRTIYILNLIILFSSLQVGINSLMERNVLRNYLDYLGKNFQLEVQIWKLFGLYVSPCPPKSLRTFTFDLINHVVSINKSEAGHWQSCWQYITSTVSSTMLFGRKRGQKVHFLPYNF